LNFPQTKNVKSTRGSKIYANSSDNRKQAHFSDVSSKGGSRRTYVTRRLNFTALLLSKQVSTKHNHNNNTLQRPKREREKEMWDMRVAVVPLLLYCGL
jgi:hypothetical protein